MARFEIKTRTPGFTGVSAGVNFAGGRAVVTSDTQEGLAALRYFAEAGYGVAALDGVEIGEVLTRANESPAAEHARLTREIAANEDRLSLDDLRKKARELEGKVFKADDTDPVDPALPAQTELLAPPADNAAVGEWRKWVVASGRLTEDDAKAADKPTLVTVHGAAYDAERDARLRATAEGGGSNG